MDIALMNRRNFLIKLYKIGGLAALFSMGISHREAELLLASQGMGPGPGAKRYAGSSGAWYYPGSFGETSFTSSDAWSTGDVSGAIITAPVSGNITKLSANMYNGTPTGCKIAIYTAEQNATLLSSGGSFDPIDAGWVDVTITPYTITNGTSVAIIVSANTSWAISCNNTSTTNGTYGNSSYSSFPPATLTQYIGQSGTTDGVRIWIE